MLSFAYILSITLACQVAAVPVDPKIVGGMNAEKGQFPHQASLRNKRGHFCGGSVLNKRWILTAAHCISGLDASGTSIVLGTNTLDKGGDAYQAVQLIPHPDYDSRNIKNDIGLIKIDKDIVFGDKVKSIDLPSENFEKIGTRVTLSGWGRTNYPGKIPNELQYITLNVIDQKKCSSMALIVRLPISETNICTLNQFGEGACHGDSGGPLINDKEQIGVVSWGIPCARGHPDVFTRVYSFLDWINEHIKDGSN